MIIELKIEEKDIELAVEKALESEFIDNLRNRWPFVQLDSKVRGYLWEICLKRRFEMNWIVFEQIDYKPSDDYSLDIDFLYKGKIIELKTSLIPEVYVNLRWVIDKADIKIIKRWEERVEDTHWDVHIQIYFNKQRRHRDEYCNSIQWKIDDYNFEELIDIMKFWEYKQAFIWRIDKPTLCNYINKLIANWEKPTWEFWFRKFRRCPLKTVAKPADTIIDYLKSL